MTCSAPGCPYPAADITHNRIRYLADLGYCTGHYRRHLHDHPEDRPNEWATAEERLWARVNKDSPTIPPDEALCEGNCWVFTAYDGTDRGKLYYPDFGYYGLTTRATILVWEWATPGAVVPPKANRNLGQVWPQWDLHHHCWTVSCVRPSHIVAVPHWANAAFPDPRSAHVIRARKRAAARQAVTS